MRMEIFLSKISLNFKHPQNFRYRVDYVSLAIAWKSAVDKRTINELRSPEIKTMLNRDIIAVRSV